MSMQSLCKLFIFFAVLLSASLQELSAQVHTSSAYEYLISPDSLLRHIRFLTSEEAGGRAAGSEGAAKCADYIERQFRSFGLLPRGISYRQEFRLPAGKWANGMQGARTGCNVIGYLPSGSKDADYIIVGAHYDHIGALGDRIFPGADDNASGVAAMLNVAQALGRRFAEKGCFRHNIIFVAFDGNNFNRAGSLDFVRRMGIPAHRISCMVNIDQIGSDMAVEASSGDYLLVLGADRLPSWQKEQMDYINVFFQLGLDIDHTYFGSEKFYNIFYRLSDQESFTAQGIPALLFTSGITPHTNKASDSVENLALPVLTARTRFIYHFLWMID